MKTLEFLQNNAISKQQMNVIVGGGSHDDCLYMCTLFDEIGQLGGPNLACGRDIVSVIKQLSSMYPKLNVHCVRAQ